MFLKSVVVSGTQYVNVSETQAARGELVFGASTGPYPSYSMRGTLSSPRTSPATPRAHALACEAARAVRVAALCDMTPDFSPIMG